MADLLTHLCTALLPGALLPLGHSHVRLVPIVAFGTVLPDLFGRAVPLALEQLYVRGWPIPKEMLWPWSALHEPAGWALLSVFLSALFVAHQRREICGALMLGCLLHTGLDLLQDHRGEGYLLFAPFSTRDFELGLMGSEATVEHVGFVCTITVGCALPRLVERIWGAMPPPIPWMLGACGLCAACSVWSPSFVWFAALCAFAMGSWPWWVERARLFLITALCLLATILVATR